MSSSRLSPGSDRGHTGLQMAVCWGAIEGCLREPTPAPSRFSEPPPPPRASSQLAKLQGGGGGGLGSSLQSRDEQVTAASPLPSPAPGPPVLAVTLQDLLRASPSKAHQRLGSSWVEQAGSCGGPPVGQEPPRLFAAPTALRLEGQFGLPRVWPPLPGPEPWPLLRAPPWRSGQ